MGDIADGMINGDFDFFTGEYIGRGYGIPRTKNKSLDWEKRPRGQRFYKKDFTQKNQQNGVTLWLRDKSQLHLHECVPVVIAYWQHMKWEIGKKKRFSRICVEIQKDFPAFMEWYNNVYKKQEIK